MGLNNSEWIKHLSFRISKKAEHEQDECLGTLEELLEAGYDTVELITLDTACPKCQQAKARTPRRALSAWISGLQHAAPLFEWTHVDCKCYLKVYKSSDPSDSKRVYHNGDYED